MKYPIEKYKFYEYTQNNSDGSKSKCIAAVSTYCGRTVKGIAICHSNDEYDFATGGKLAAARCNYKVCDKRVSRASKKLEEAQKILDEAAAHYNRMLKYYRESIDERAEAKEELLKLADELK